jgi:outer membrane protein assembly factor BamD (BamD/ComL family)
LLDAQTFAAANPEDLNQQAVQFENVARDHAGTEAAEEALRRAEALQQEIASAAELADRQAWREARAEAEALRYAEPPEYQAAVNRLQAFMANHAGGPHVAEAQQMIGEIRGEVSAELAETRERANEMVARGNYDRAIELVDHFTSTYRLDEFSTQAAALKKEIETKLLEGYMRAAEAANTHADNFRFDRAISEFKRLRDRYRGTSFSEMASARVESLEKLKRLHQLVIDSIEQRGQQAGRVPEALLPEILQQQGIEKVFLAEADEIGMELMYSPNDHPPYVGRHPMPWEKVTAQQYYAVLEHLYPRTPRPDDAVIELIAAFTSAHKLDRESEIWRAMLEQ